MKNFIEPIPGTKIAEYRISSFTHFIISATNNINFLINILVFFLFLLGIETMIDPPQDLQISLWKRWTVGIILCILYLGYAIVKISNAWTNTSENLKGKLFSVFLVNNGLEINNILIPFKEESIIRKGHFNNIIKSFKIDGDFLSIKTDREFISIHGKSENEIKFKIDANYLSCKEELLRFLNKQIDASEFPNDEK